MSGASPNSNEVNARAAEERLGHTLHELRTPLNQIIGLSEMLMEIAEEEGLRDFVAGIKTVREAGLELAGLLVDRQMLSIEPVPGDGYWPLTAAIRAPIGQVLGYAHVVLGEEPDARLEEFRPDLQKIRQAAQRFLEMARETGISVCLRSNCPDGVCRPEAEPTAVASPALAGSRILVVDDESLNREVLCRRLEREGCRPTGVDSGSAALALLRAEAYDAILLDMLMPEMSGLEVLQTLKADDRLRFIPVVMLSAHTEVDRVARCLELGAEDYLPKPINAVLLRARLGACLEKRRMAEEILRAGKLQSVGLLAGGLAHDFNNMLTTVLGNLSLLRFAEELSPRAKTSLEAAERGAVRAQELTRYLLTFAEGGAPAKERLEPAGLLEEIAQVTLRAADRHAELRFAGELWPIEADPHQLTQVVSNILANAIEATKQGATIAVTAENISGPIAALDLHGERYLKFSVRDRGCGIPPADLPRVFDPFFTTKANARGLGLALAYSIVERHGGHLELASSPGTGTTATFFLPALTDAMPENLSLNPAPIPAAPVPATDEPRRVRVLVMDDEPDIRNLMEMMLSMFDYDVVTTASGEEALAAHEKAIEESRRFDVAIMDLTVPNGMGGAEMIKRLRQKDTVIRTVVASGYSDDPVVARHKEYGFDRVLPKPYVLNDLNRVMDSLKEPSTR
ncbi:MAG TPA: response regulator [Chthoniobacteraceae bacterium]|jgi:signal transduction histidine kinase|nr:response regulator [Chthoniobacteraceae bacterium]